MKTEKDDEKNRLIDPVWYCLGEFPLDKFLAIVNHGDGTAIGLEFKSFADLGIGYELLSIIERKLAWFASEMLVQLNQSRFEAPVSIRLFCLKKTIVEVNDKQPSKQSAQWKVLKTNPIIHQPVLEADGGWGYFLVKRSGNLHPGDTISSKNYIDLYLYKEG
jgi:hypothetical protein